MRRTSIKPLPMTRDNHWAQLWTDEFESNGFFFEAPDGSLKLVKDIFRHLDQTPWPEPLRRDFVRWRTDMKRYYAGEKWREWLDTMTYEDYLVKVMGLNPAVGARWADPSMAGGVGLGSDVLSATAAAQIPDARVPGIHRERIEPGRELGYSGLSILSPVATTASHGTW